MSRVQPFRFATNPNLRPVGAPVLPEDGFRAARDEIASWEGYAATPLRDLPDVARELGVAAVRLKDESGRFGLGSFKALGGAYAVARAVRAAATPITVACATDGNHGRAVAWGARRFGAGCVIFVHASVSQGRVDAIARYGAEIRRVPGSYDDAVREAARVAAAEGWVVVSDTSWPGYVDIPVDVMQGYRVMADEAVRQWTGPPPTHAFIQAGVGGVAAAVSVQLRQAASDTSSAAPRLIVVEPACCASLLESSAAGRMVGIDGEIDTLMAGLSCGEPSLLAWQELGAAAFGFMAIPDAAAVDAMRLLARAGLAIGESGVAGLAALRLAAADPTCRSALGLGADSRVLLFGTEGDTDPALYRELVAGGGGHG